MTSPQDGPALHPIEWVGLSVRWLMLGALPVVAGLTDRLGWALVVVLILWAAFSMAIGLLAASGQRAVWHGWVVAGIDVVFALAAIGASGSLASPLWWSLLIGVVQAGLAYGMVAALSLTALGVIASAALVLATVPREAEVLVPLGLYSGGLMLAGASLGWLTEQTRDAVPKGSIPEPRHEAPLRIGDHEQVRTVFQLASELNATLNYERVLEMALDLSAKAMAEEGPEDEHLVSALLVFTDQELRVASARRLTHSDLRVTLPGEEGAIGQSLHSGDSSLLHEPARDPELTRLVALHNCREALVIPLAVGLEAYGILLFGHPKPDYFTAERAELLEAIGHQAMVALQNARLYRDLEQEKERITEIQEDARRKLARDLHDGPTQSIAAIAMRVNFARRLMERDAKAASDELFKVEDLARRTTKEIRHMLFTLRPLILESQGLVAALNQLAEKVRETHGQNVMVEAQPGAAEQLELGKQGVVFYIAEEAINNARKHAEARHIWVRLRMREEFFVLEVEDDGVGFNVGAVDTNYEQRGSLGMVNMRERAELVSGMLRIDSSEGIGTRITVYVPLSEESAERLQRTGMPL
ncbi:MAG TPA: histidine kinase [Anaerolineales bacterium]|nr:histidine kinase [Anaerolineales bacterium]